MLKTELFSIGDLRISVYDFNSNGDILPMHSHTINDNHITIVARGSIELTGINWKKDCVSGDVLDFADGQDHEIKSTSDGTRIINIIKKLQA